MPIGSAAFAAGPYTVTWNSIAMGLLRGDNQMIRIARKHQRIENTNKYAQSLIGAVYLGRDARFSATLMEWKAALSGWLTLLFPESAGSPGQIGTLGTDSYDGAQALVLTATAGSLAASNGPATLTANKAVMAENFPVDLAFNPQLREIPLALDLMPYVSTVDVNFTYT